MGHRYMCSLLLRIVAIILFRVTESNQIQSQASPSRSRICQVHHASPYGLLPARERNTHSKHVPTAEAVET